MPIDRFIANANEYSVSRILIPYGITYHKPCPNPVCIKAVSKLPRTPIPIHKFLPNRKANNKCKAYNKIQLPQSTSAGTRNAESGNFICIPITGSNIAKSSEESITEKRLKDNNISSFE